MPASFARQSLFTLRSVHRTHETISDLLLAYSSLALALDRVAPRLPPFGEDDIIALESRLFPVELRLPAWKPVEAAAGGFEPDTISLAVVPRANPDEPRMKMPTFGRFIERAAASAFCSYSEPWIEWLKQQGDPRLWPPISAFVRIVRNALTHNNTVSANSPNAPSASWYGLEYGHAQNGRKVLYNDLSAADLMFLMVEHDEELGRLNAPFSPP